MCIYSSVYMYIMATHPSILAWEIPWMEKPGRLWSMGSQRVRHDWTTSLHFIYSSDCFLMQVITRYWVFSPVLYNRTLLFSTLYIIACICYSHIPNLSRPLLFPLISKFAFYVWVCFCFINKLFFHKIPGVTIRIIFLKLIHLVITHDILITRMKWRRFSHYTC